MGRFLCDLWRVVAQMRGPVPRLRNNAEKWRPPSVLTLPSQNAFFCTAQVGGRPERTTPLLGEALEVEMVENQVPIASVAYSCGGAPLFVLTHRTHRLGGHLTNDTQLLFKASFATSANVRSRPRRPMKPLEELLNPPERGTQPEQNQQRDAQPDRPAATIGARAPEAALPSAARETIAQKPSHRRFGVVSPQELPSGSSWVGRNGGPDRRTGRNGQGSVNQQESLNGGRAARATRMEDLRDDRNPAVAKKRMGMADSLQRRSEPGPNRVSFAQILKSSKASPQKPASETPSKDGSPQERKKAIPIPEEDPEDIDSIPLRSVAAPRAIPSWKVGLANREKRAAKAAATDGEQRVNEAITASTVRLVDPEGGSHEVVSIGEALNRARKAGLDVVEVNARSDPPVCKLVDYKKFKFEAKKKEKDRKKQELEQRREKIVKEIRLSSRTDYRDMEMKARTAKEHLALGYQVRCFLQFKKGDRRADIGLQLLPEMLKLLESHGTVNKPPREAGGRLEMYLRPLSLAERKKLPEYRKEAGPEPAPESSKKRKAMVRSEEEGLEAEAEESGETEKDLAAESKEEWADEGAEEDESESEEEEPSEEVEGTGGEEDALETRLESELEKTEFEEFDEERGRNEGDEEEEEVVMANEDGRTDEGMGVLETSDGEAAQEEKVEQEDESAYEIEDELDEADLMAEFLREDFRKSDAEEESKSVLSPKRKRWADRLRRPLRPKPSRKRRQADSDSDDEEDVRVRRALDSDNEEYDGTKPSRKRRQADSDSDDDDDVPVRRAFNLDKGEYESSGSDSDGDSNKDKSRHRRRR
ncbi:Translation initiation factor 3 [Klebsormidium nitens]|uniref:Translation initiation factor 3 n=1 Tax=Klebsormidium nitens TaxID=105231 RepID=A0A1Y1I8K7_KLENI|nr:Translation initiation factor 3 [Klebsormidium nitens]|eukprot:GAQ86863.1 Translation initiation factor 3 [Klebsormidium nitens]